MLQFFGQFHNQIFINDRVHVFAQQIQNEPVSVAETLNDSRNHAHLHISQLTSNHQRAKRAKREHQNTKQNGQSGKKRQNNKPEPEDHEDLFVYYVQRQNAEAVFELQAARRTIVSEPALGEFGEELVHGVDRRKVHHIGGEAWCVRERCDRRAVVAECAAQEHIQQEYLTNLKGFNIFRCLLVMACADWQTGGI